MNMNRRQFIVGLSALAATAVIVKADGMTRLLTQTEQEKFLAMARTGVIRDQWFEFSGPVVLKDFDHLTIDGCHLIFKNMKPGEYCLRVVNCHHVMLTNNYIECDSASFLWDDIPQNVKWDYVGANFGK